MNLNQGEREPKSILQQPQPQPPQRQGIQPSTANKNTKTNIQPRTGTTTTTPTKIPQRLLAITGGPRAVTRGLKRQLEQQSTGNQVAVPAAATSSKSKLIAATVNVQKLQRQGAKTIPLLNTPASASAKVTTGKRLNYEKAKTATATSATSVTKVVATTVTSGKVTTKFKIEVPRGRVVTVTTNLAGPSGSRNVRPTQQAGPSGINIKKQRTATETKSKQKPITFVDLGTPPRETTVAGGMPSVRPPGNEVFGGLNAQDDEFQIIQSSSASISPISDNGDSGHGGSPSPEINESGEVVDVDRMAGELSILLTFENCTTCSFCTEKLEIGDGIVLQDCFHSFCRPCLTTVVENSSSAEISCPIECGGRLYQREIKALMPTHQYDAYVKRTENKIKELMGGDVFQCKTKNCRGCCMYEADSKVFLCPECNKGNCLSCKAIHDGLECKDFQDLLATAIREGKSQEEAEQFVHSQLANGWEQFLGTVSGWIGSTSAGKNRRTTQDYTKILQKMAQKDLWLSTREFECPVCMGEIQVGDGIILQDCLHTVCKECAVGTIQFATQPEVKCPYQDGNYSCTSHLNPREIKALVTPELHDAFLARSVKQAEGAIPNSFHCKTPDCPGWCVFEQGAQVYECQNCAKRNCLACEAIHENVSCADYKNKLVQNANDETSRKMLEAMIAKGECMLCPTCKIVAEKTAGCDWIVCSICKTEICWATKGPRWGPKGQGDTSGGCHCKEGGKLCVPTCRNCH